MKENPNDIFEYGNVILTFGKNLIEIFCFSQNNNNNNNNNNFKLEKKYEFNINNNNNINDNIINNNNNNLNEIMSIQFYNSLFICGHRSGFISIWNLISITQINKKGEIQLTKSAINKLYFEKIPGEKDYLYICCADGTVLKFSFELSKVVMTSKQFDAEIIDIKMVSDFDKKNILIISMNNGALKVLDLNLNYLYDIPSRFKYNKVRYVIGLKNPLSMKDNTKGDLLLITEGNCIDVFTWIKPGSFQMNIHQHKERANKQQNNDNNYPMQCQPYQQNTFNK